MTALETHDEKRLTDGTGFDIWTGAGFWAIGASLWVLNLSVSFVVTNAVTFSSLFVVYSYDAYGTRYALTRTLLLSLPFTLALTCTHSPSHA